MLFITEPSTSEPRVHTTDTDSEDKQELAPTGVFQAARVARTYMCYALWPRRRWIQSVWAVLRDEDGDRMGLAGRVLWTIIKILNCILRTSASHRRSEHGLKWSLDWLAWEGEPGGQGAEAVGPLESCSMHFLPWISLAPSSGWWWLLSLPELEFQENNSKTLKVGHYLLCARLCRETQPWSSRHRRPIEGTQASTERYIKCGVYIERDIIQPEKKKGGNFDTSCNRVKPWRYYAEQNRSVTKG